MRHGMAAALTLGILAVLTAAAASACGGAADRTTSGGGLFRQYEYEEEVYVSLDGTATVYVNASLAALNALRGASFLWIKDLAQPDTVATVAGFAINPLPLVMVVTMIWQQKLTPQTGDAQQQKMMMFMPLMMLLFFYKTAAGLTLYWTLQQLLSVLQQWWSMRREKQTTGKPA